MSVEQSVQNPFGLSVFGSSTIRVEPDVASLSFAVSSLKQHPKEAFGKAHEAARGIRAYLAKAGISEVRSSRITLTQTYQFQGGERRFVGYTARVAFHILLRDLDRMEELLVGIVNAGANEISSVQLQTSRLKEIRAEARQRAVKAAREKAEIYSEAAGVTLGRVIHIEDVNPNYVRRPEYLQREGHVFNEIQPDDEGPLRALDPGSIVVAGAVIIAFEIG